MRRPRPVSGRQARARGKAHSARLRRCQGTCENREGLRENLRDDQFTVDHPRRTLEEYFIDVIARAKSESVETAGVVGGGKIADYLARGDETSAILETLIAEPAPVAAPQVPENNTAAPSTEELSEKLEKLTGEVKAQPVEVEPAPTPDEDLEKVNDKLTDLLGKRDETK